MNQAPRIVLTGGGSGGHITPLLSLAHELKTQVPACQITYIGHKGDNFDSLKISSKDFDFMAFINGGKFRRYHGESLLSHLIDMRTIFFNIRDFFRVINSIGGAVRILRKTRPDVVFSKGGFVVVPVGIAAKLLRIPIVTHDSDTVPGLANRIVGRWAAVNATGMPAKYYAYPKERIRYVGVPLSSVDIKPLTKVEQESIRVKLNLPAQAQILMVAGGGNGSKRLNDLMLAIAPELFKSNLALRIVHITGQSHEETVRQAYSELLEPTDLKRVKVIGFTPQFDAYAGAADLIISRAGATALAEFAALKKACVIMPSPFLAGGYQLKNAEELTSKDAAAVIDEETRPDELLVVVSELLNNERRRGQLASNLHALAKPDAAKKLAEIILAVAASGAR